MDVPSEAVKKGLTLIAQNIENEISNLPDIFRNIQMKFEKGQSGNTTGKPPGTINKINRIFKELVLETVNALNENPETSLLEFAKKYPRDFWAIAARLIPTEVKGSIIAEFKIPNLENISIGELRQLVRGPTTEDSESKLGEEGSD